MAARGRLLLTAPGLRGLSMLGGVIVAHMHVSSQADRRFPAGTFSALGFANDFADGGAAAWVRPGLARGEGHGTSTLLRLHFSCFFDTSLSPPPRRACGLNDPHGEFE